ncbi:MAG TPA: twin-arginine translocation pathway signal protein [Caldimonas sp.]|jgi:nitroreductase|nr:twin-arginine translocation pathway signal protein [Caldimonas sp.]HEX2543126.1 twin-arginine translocation pathway signal protein [Caldimonas sp.]
MTQPSTRRDFIRIAGGSVIAGAVGPLAACSTDYPRDAVAAWQGPVQETDLRRWALGYAILAPNSHNRQPWVADLREADSIVLRVDRERLLPQTDPHHRQIVVSQGTFLEALVLALQERGLAPQVQLFPDGEFGPRSIDDRPVARVTWRPSATAAPRDALFAQLLRRHTAKVDYDTARAVDPATLPALASTLVDPAVRFGGTVDPAQLEALRTICWESAQVELQTPRTVMESIRLTRVGPAEIDRHRDGISINGLMPRLASAVGAFRRDQPPAPGSTAYKTMISRFEGHSRTAMGFVWLSTPAASGDAAAGPRAGEVRAGRAYMRLQLKATELGLQVHPMSQALQEFAEMKPHYDRLHTLLVGKPASDEPLQMFCRIGYAAAQPHTPRRGVEAVVRR